MKLEILNQIFQMKNPTGKIFILCSNGELLDSGKNTGKFAVQYSEGSKLYNYSYKSVYALAERLNLIPENNLDYKEEARKAIESINNGIPFISICGLSDTMRYMLGNNDIETLTLVDDVHIDNDYCECDIYGRQQYIYKGYTINGK